MDIVQKVSNSQCYFHFSESLTHLSLYPMFNGHCGEFLLYILLHLFYLDIESVYLSRQQNVGQNWDIKVANRSFENVPQLKYWG
jgi:hypothetical protein